MNRIRSYLVAAVCLLGVAGTALAIAPDFKEKLAADSRPAEDKARDAARMPYEVMMLLGVEEGMNVVDVGAGGGWYTRVLSAAVGPSGKVISQGLRGDNASIEALGNVQIVANMSDIPANSADVAVTALNIHHMNDARGEPYMKDLIRILKPGGVAAVIDHVGDPNTDNSQLHRIPSAQARAWIEKAGFEIVSQPDILHRSNDDHTLSARDPKLGRNPDRFFFLVRKPR